MITLLDQLNFRDDFKFKESLYRVIKFGIGSLFSRGTRLVTPVLALSWPMNIHDFWGFSRYHLESCLVKTSSNETKWAILRAIPRKQNFLVLNTLHSPWRAKKRGTLYVELWGMEWGLRHKQTAATIPSLSTTTLEYWRWFDSVWFTIIQRI